MTKERYTRIIGTGSYLPPKIIKNSHFLNNEFYDPSTKKIFEKTNEEIIQKFTEITNIEERRYVDDRSGDIGYCGAGNKRSLQIGRDYQKKASIL